ncbi:MAG TPA: GNAT family N-acetyltransferase [Ferrovibrio sp.]|uniref:GNAT family N-acetyltransferase n=1 Tax=Ferrovibrio sp. TaxID=1917215 RepID=UPI002ED450B1
MIATTRLMLRPPQLGDASALARLMTEDVSRWTAAWPYPLSEAAAREKLRETLAAMAAGQCFARAIARPGHDDAIGWLGVALIASAPPTGSLGYWLGAAFHRQGYLSEALPPFVQAAIAVLRLSRLETGVQPANAASLALLRRLGMRFVETRMHHVPARRREELTAFYAMDCSSAFSPSR